MGLFSNILEKLGLNKKKEEEAKKPLVNATPIPAKPKPNTATGVAHTTPKPTGTMAPSAFPTSPRTQVTPMSEVDVISKFEVMAKAKTEKLDWKLSIVDLLKLLDLDSSLAARKDLAKELGCPADKIGGDYAEMNVWLHKEVLKRIAANGGNIPANLL